MPGEHGPRGRGSRARRAARSSIATATCRTSRCPELAENAVIGVPIRSHGQLVGFFGIGARPPRKLRRARSRHAAALRAARGHRHRQRHALPAREEPQRAPGADRARVAARVRGARAGGAGGHRCAGDPRAARLPERRDSADGGGSSGVSRARGRVSRHLPRGIPAARISRASPARPCARMRRRS